MSSLISSNKVGSTSGNPVHFKRSFQLVFCTECKTFIPSSHPNMSEAKRKEQSSAFVGNESIFRGVVSRHLRQQHQLVAAKANLFEKEVAFSYLQVEDLSEEEEQKRMTYMKYYEKSDTHPEGWPEVLDQVSDLSTMDALQCSKCYGIYTSQKYANAHKKSCGGEIISILAQSLFGGNKVRRYFRVSDKDAEKSNWLSDMFHDVEGGNDKSGIATTPSQRDPLLNIIKFDMYLESKNIALEDAYSACRLFTDQDVKKKMESMIFSYIEKARNEIARNLFIQTHSFMESSIHLMIGAESVKRYVSSILFLLNFLRNITDQENILFNPSENNVPVRECINRLNEIDWGQDINADSFYDLHIIFKDLFFSDVDTNTHYSIPAFINFFGLTSDNRGVSEFRFINGAELSPLLAALLYLMKCTVVIELYVMPSEKRPSHYRSSSHAGWSYFKSLTQDDRDCGATYVRYCMNVCNGIRSTEMSRIRFIKCQKHPKCAIIDGHEISIEMLGNSIKRIQKDMTESIDRNVLFGFWKLLTNDFLSDIKKFKDNWSNNTVHYWFGKHENNIAMLQKWRNKFSQHLIREGFIRGDKTFDTNRCKRFMVIVEEFIQKLYVLIHVGSGSPPRGTELGVIQVCNGPHATRHIFMDQGHLLIVIKYHKGRDKLDGTSKPIARYTDQTTNILLLAYLIFIRPLETLIVRQLSKSASAGTKNESSVLTCPLFLFSCRGLLISENVLRKTFSRYLHEKGCNLNMSQYRQYFTGAVKHFNLMECKRGEALLLELSDILHIQAGHSVSTAHSIYGVSELDISSLDSVKLDQYRSASIAWQIAIGLHTLDQESSPVQRTSKENIQANEELRVADISSFMKVITDSIRDIRNELCTVRNLLKVSSFPIHRGSEETKNLASSSSGDENHEVSALNVIRDLTKNRNGAFRSTEQKEAILTCLNRRKDGLFILPTGSGKSFTFMVMASLLANGIVLVFVPLISLQLDILGKCSQAGIHAVRWEERHSAGAKIVLCSVEHVTKDSYRSFVSEKFSLGTIAAIFFDEAHLLKHWENFRVAMNHVKHYIRPSHVQVPVYGLTATCPPVLEDSLIKSLALTDPVVIRMSGTRTNISYNYYQVTEDSLNLKLIQTIIEAVDEEGMNGQTKTFRAIVYCATRELAESYPEKIRFVIPTSVNLFHYHAGMRRVSRTEQQEKWAEDIDSVRCNVMFCTSAFGCGINFPDVRLVVHLELPTNILSYLQESGRAGRDGKPAKSVVLDICGDHGPAQSMPDITQGEDLDDTFEKNYETWNSGEKEDELYGSLDKWRKEVVPRCRRITLDSYNEGVVMKSTCIERRLVNCDVCNNWNCATSREHPMTKVLTPQHESIHKSSLKDEHNTLTGTGDSQSKSRMSSLHGLSRSVHRESISQDEAKVFQADKGVMEISASGCGQRPDSSPYYSQFRPDGIKRVKLSPIVNHDMNNITSGKGCYSLHNLDPAKAESNETMKSEEKGRSCSTILFERPRRDISAGEITEIALKLVDICPVCSGMNRRRICSCRNVEKACFAKRCLKCGSKSHFLSSCFMKSWKSFDNSCRKCSMKSHGRRLVHEPGTYGRDCPHLNCIRLIIVIFEYAPTRKALDEAFPDVKALNKADMLVGWLRSSDDEDNTWYGTVLKWIVDKFFFL